MTPSTDVAPVRSKPRGKRLDEDATRWESFKDPARWKPVKENFRRWWAGKSDRPMIQIFLRNAPTDLPEPPVPWQAFASFYGLDTPLDAIMDAWEHRLSTTRFLGDAFPHINFNFGPGVAAAFMGARPENRPPDTTWFHAPDDREIPDIHLEYDPDNVFWNRVKDVFRAGAERFGASAHLAMTDLGGNLDLLSTFRPGEKLLMDLIDHPEDVERVTWEAHHLWWRYFGELNEIIQAAHPGYSSWAPMFSEDPYYMLQCDFCYMIGTPMFDRFVKPELAASCKRLSNAFYHLDGKGQLPHLDSLLSIKELKGVQWVPGAGRPGFREWPEVYRKIHAAGKLIQFFDDLPAMNVIKDQIGTASPAVIVVNMDWSRRDEAEAFLREWNAL